MKNILVRIPQWLGDAVVSTVFLKHLKAKHPEDKIFVVCPRALADIFLTHPDVDKVLVLPYDQGGTVWATAALLKANKIDEVYILPKSFRTALEMWLARIPRRIGFSGDWRSGLLTDVISYDADAYYPNRYLKLIGEEKISLDQERPYFPKANMSNEKAIEILGANIFAMKKPFLGLAPASIAPSRTWPVDRFLQVARQFQKEKNGTVILFGSPKEKLITAKIKSQLDGPAIDSAGKLNLPELGWLMSRCNILLANDSGLMHVASAFDIPTVVLFGASDPTYAAPRTGRVASIQHKEIPCVPCLRNHCVLLGDKHLACLNAISVEEALASLSSM